MRSWYFVKNSRARARLTAELVQDGADLEVDVRHRVEHLRGAAEIVAVPPEVRGDEARLRMTREEPIALARERLERGKLAARILTSRETARARATARC